MNDEIIVSVSCLVYNHEKYLRKCLEGFVTQKTNFKFEVIVHDDASTDNSAAIIKEYEEKYPDIIKPIYQVENQYSNPNRKIGLLALYIFPVMKGKYVAFCEGDDYWCDPNKLQRQVDILENNPDCSLCVHRVEDVYEDGSFANVHHPSKAFKKGVYSPKEIMDIMKKYMYPFQTSSYMLKLENMIHYRTKYELFYGKFGVGDIPIILSSILEGNIYYIDDVLSCYRVGVEGSYNYRMKTDTNKMLVHKQKMIDAYILYNEYTQNRFESQINEIIETYQYDIDMINGEYKKYLSKKYKHSFDKSERMLLFMKAYMPKLLSLYYKVRK